LAKHARVHGVITENITIQIFTSVGTSGLTFV